MIHRKTQAMLQGNPRNPFHTAVSWQKLSHGSHPSVDAVKRGFALRLAPETMKLLSPWSAVRPKSKMLYGMDQLLAGSFLLPIFRPAKHEIQELQTEMGISEVCLAHVVWTVGVSPHRCRRTRARCTSRPPCTTTPTTTETCRTDQSATCASAAPSL